MNSHYKPIYWPIRIFLNCRQAVNMWVRSAWIETAWPPFWSPRGQQVSHQRWIWGICCRQLTKHISKGIHPGFETQGKSHQGKRHQRSNISGPTKRADVVQTFKKRRNVKHPNLILTKQFATPAVLPKPEAITKVFLPPPQTFKHSSCTTVFLEQGSMTSMELDPLQPLCT